MMRKPLSWIALWGAVFVWVAPGAAYAGFAACTVADIIAKEASCPNNSNPCIIAQDYDVSANACFFDFGTRTVTINGTSVIDLLDRQGVRIKAGSITMKTQSRIVGQGSAGNQRGASITIETSGDFKTEGIALIDVGTSDLAGDVFLDIGGNATLEGRIVADGSTDTGIAGEIIIRAGGNISTVRELSANNGNLSFSPGTIELTAEGTVTIGGLLDVAGGDGGAIDVDAGLGVTTNAVLDANGNGDAGTGGSIDILSGRGMTINEPLQANGNGGTGNTGGDGGTVLLEALYGDIALNDNVNAIGGVPDGSGDEISLVAEGSITLATGITLSARTDGALGSGGSLGVEAEVDVISTGILEASGGLEGGDLSISAGRNLQINRLVDAKGRNPGAFGGSVFVDAGLRTRGTLTINNTVDASGGICSSLEGCGAGGLLSLTGCAVTLTSSASLQNRGADGGDTFITARGLLTVSSATVVNATTNVGLVQGSNGSNTFEHAAAVTPSISPLANVQPPATVAALAISACSTCGNNIVEVDEDCDDGNTNGCDGCSFACETENCNDGNRCTVDSCQNLLGCLVGEAVPAGTACCDGSKERNCSGLSDQCNTGVCNLATDACVAQVKADGTSCNDGLSCTSGDTCTSGTCGLAGCICAPSGGAGDPCSDLVLCNLAPGGPDGCRVEVGPDGDACTGTTPTAFCCGNGVIDPTEQCDSGAGNSQNPNASCRTDCKPRRCGDGVVDNSFGESCDDGNTTNGDGCSSVCGVQPTFTPTRTSTPSPTPTIPPAVAGEVRYYAGTADPVPDVKVDLSGAQTASQTTTADGLYDFGNRTQGNYGVRPSKTGGAGDDTITAYDAALALRAANGLDSFTGAQNLACDVNRDGVVDENDVTLLLQYRVGIVPQLPVVGHCGAWAFVPTGVGPEVVAPLTTGVTCETGRRQYTPLATRRVEDDFLAVLFGDCSGNWTSPSID